MKLFKRIFICLTLVCSLLLLVACKPIDKKYYEKVSNYSFWDNKGNEAIAQYQIYNIIDSFLNDGEKVGNKIISKEGKTKKVAFIGWDGTRADSISNIMHDTNNFATNSYNYSAEFSALNKLKSQGGLYLAYAGGDSKSNFQSTSTCSGWTSELTGKWGVESGVKTNDDIKNEESDTIMLKWAKLGLQTSFGFDWGQLLDLNWKNEVNYLMKNPNVKLEYCDLDRKVVSNETQLREQEKLGDKGTVYADSIAQYNAVANKNEIANAPYDTMARDYMLSRINEGDDIVAGIFHTPDTNGHTSGFGNQNNTYVNSVRNADNYSYQVIKEIENREATLNEEWLIIVTADHGGYGNGHGEQFLEARTIWVASNKAIDKKYFASTYNGYKI